MSRSRLLAVGAMLGAVVVPTVPATAGAVPYGRRALHRPMQGHDVRVLQRYLTRVGVPTAVDGQYGRGTKASVRTWESSVDQRLNGRVSRGEARMLRRQVRALRRVAVPEVADSAPAPEPALATLDAAGHAIAPSSAPDRVQAVIAAANRIVGKPYRYGGGHGRWEDSGYDCSGSESYALRGGGFVSAPLTSSGYESFGEAGRGRWITSYASSGHSFLVVAGLRFDTGWNNAGNGPRWSGVMRPSDGYVVRHPAGY